MIQFSRSLNLQLNFLLLGALLTASFFTVSTNLSAQDQESVYIAPRIHVTIDTSGSMTLSPAGKQTFGDGVADPVYGTDCGSAAGHDINCDDQINDSRLFIAKKVFRDVLSSTGNAVEWSLARFQQIQPDNEDDKFCFNSDVTYAQFEDSQPPGRDLECVAPAGLHGDLTCNTGNIITRGNCTFGIQGTWGNIHQNFDAACAPPVNDPGNPDEAQPLRVPNWNDLLNDTDNDLTTNPNPCLNYGLAKCFFCPNEDPLNPNENAECDNLDLRNALDLDPEEIDDVVYGDNRYDGLGRFLTGADVLVGFPGVGPFENQTSNLSALLRWIDNRDSLFTEDMEMAEQGNFCNHANNEDANCELRAMGSTPLGNSIVVGGEYLKSTREEEFNRGLNCRPYFQILLTDGDESCGADPNVRAQEFSSLNTPIYTYVIGFGLSDGQIGRVNALAQAGGTNRAFLANDEASLAAAFSAILAEAIESERCDGQDNDCDGRIDEDFFDPDNNVCFEGEGECRQQGEFVCTGQFEASCDAIAADVPDGVPFCNDGLDNDCDGRIDEFDGEEDNCNQRSAEICNGLDDDLDGSIDENFPNKGQPCTRGRGECITNGTFKCDNDDGVVLPGGVAAAGLLVCVNRDNELITDEILANTQGENEFCNRLDDDCDGRIDEAPPGEQFLTEACGAGIETGIVNGVETEIEVNDEEGECNFGRKRCIGGFLQEQCVGRQGPLDEVCDGLDNNCNGQIDEEGFIHECDPNPACETPVCQAGILNCQDNREAEICDNVDNDCDGQIDENNGSLCGERDTGECAFGIIDCTQPPGQQCVGAIGPQPEICNGLDDNCENGADENFDIQKFCSLNEAGELIFHDNSEEACGITQCSEDGSGVVCSGQAEICDGIDNDCDGNTDEDPDDICPGDTVCVQSYCAAPCQENEFGIPCQGTETDIDDPTFGCRCIPRQSDACDETCERKIIRAPGDGTILCGPNRRSVGKCVCKEGLGCTHPCDEVECPNGQSCNPLSASGQCILDCLLEGCPEGQFCNTAQEVQACQNIPCVDVNCPAGQFCRNDACVASCANVECEAGEQCKEGQCVNDPCSEVTCERGQQCNPQTAECVAPCDSTCPRGSVCDLNTRSCVTDPCASVKCGTGEFCREGDCFTTPTEPDPPTPPTTEQRRFASGGGGCSIQKTTSTPYGNMAIFAVMIGLVFRALRKRLNIKQLATTTTLFIGLIVSGCGVETVCVNCGDENQGGNTSGVGGSGNEQNPDTGGNTGTGGNRGGGQTGGDIGTGNFAVCDIALDEVCNEIDDDCDGRIDEGIDTSSDPENCGRCGTVCSLLNVRNSECVDGQCTIGTCMPFHFDNNQDTTDGCEYPCPFAVTTEELCDGLDNDCDGTVDEGFDILTNPNHCGACGRVCTNVLENTSQATCEPVPENMGGMGGNNGEAPPDEGMGGSGGDTPEAMEELPAKCMHETCNQGYRDADGEPGCECLVTNGGVERCDGTDNDCNGVIDDLPEIGELCGNVDAAEICSEVRDRDVDFACPCQTGTFQCLELNPGEGNWKLQCDGKTDPSDFDDCSLPNQDNDCDGRADEDTLNPGTPDPNHCGTCGNVCGAGENQIAQCQNGNCGDPTCERGFVDANGDSQNQNNIGDGCEVSCPNDAGVETCNSADDDCDGRVDEDIDFPDGICRQTGVCGLPNAGPVCSDGEIKCNYELNPGDFNYNPNDDICDGLDNNCNGLIDDLFIEVAVEGVRDAFDCYEPLPNLANYEDDFPGVGARGQCLGSGTYQCAPDGLSSVCVITTEAQEPSEEACDNIDNDCDGQIDNGVGTVVVDGDTHTFREGLSMAEKRDVVVGEGANAVNIEYYPMNFEASRPDATSESRGQVTSHACSQLGVVPSTQITWESANEACCELNESGACITGEAGPDQIPVPAGWHLCTNEQWFETCTGGSDFCTSGWGYAGCLGTDPPDRCNTLERDCDINTDGNQNCLKNTGSSGNFCAVAGTAVAGTGITDMTGNAAEMTRTKISEEIVKVPENPEDPNDDQDSDGFDIYRVKGYGIRGGSYLQPLEGGRCDFQFLPATHVEGPFGRADLGLDQDAVNALRTYNSKPSSLSLPNLGYRCCYTPPIQPGIVVR